MKHVYFTCVLVLALLSTATAQESRPASTISTLTITATATGERVRITAPASIVQLHVEVYAASGEKLFDQEIRGGNVFDWHLQDGQARLAPGAYVCVVTAKSISGKLTQKIGTVRVEEKSVSVQPADSPQLSVQQTQAIGPVEENSSWTIPGQDEPRTPTVIANDGTDGQMIRGRGALSFRIGDFFSGIDQEQMRLTAAGNLGIGTSEPKSKLDVAGTIRAERFVIVKPKTSGGKAGDSAQATDSADSIQPLVFSGSGTPNQIAKWILADTLGDSGITEAGSGNIGINQAVPDGKLSIVTAPNTYALRTSGGNLETYLQHGVSSGTWFTNSTGGFTINNQAGPLAFSANNTETMRITNNFLVGIGTSAPGGKLHIGTLPNTYALRTSGGNLETYLQHGAGAGIWYVNSSGGFTINNQAGPLAFSANNTEAMRIINTGSIGIGMAAPGGRLHIGTAADTYALRTSGGSLETFLSHGSTSGTWFTNTLGGFTFSNQLGPLAFSANNAEVMRITTNGNVGIGTTAPSAYGHGGTNVLTEIRNAAGANNSQAHLILSTGATANTGSIGTITWAVPNTTGTEKRAALVSSSLESDATSSITSNLAFWTTKAGLLSEKMRITSAGNVGIGTNNPTALLHIVGARPAPVISGNGTNAPDALTIIAAKGGETLTGISGGAGGNVLIQAGDGGEGQVSGVPGSISLQPGRGARVYIGNSPAAVGSTLVVEGKTELYGGPLELFDGDFHLFSLTSSGTPLCTDGSKKVIACASSLRYKSNVQTFFGGLAVINRLRPIAFNWKQGGMRDIGFGAEEVEKVEPLLTFRNDKGEIEGVKYNQLSAVFVNAFREQQSQIAALRAANTAINARLRLIERARKNQPTPTRHRR